MVFIIGGAYQGKLDYAISRFELGTEDVFCCDGLEIDWSKRCVDHLERFTWACVQQSVDPIAWFREHREQWENSILICQDIFCGVVPMGAENRIWRQITGRLCQYLSQEAQQVSRIFCGLEQRLK